jgi:hypothetical protein
MSAQVNIRITVITSSLAYFVSMGRPAQKCFPKGLASQKTLCWACGVLYALPMKLKLTAFALSTVAAVTLSGCIKADVDAKIKANTKMDATMIVAFSEETMKMMESMAGSMGDTDSKTPTTKAKSMEAQMKESVAKAQKDLPKGSKVSFYKKDGWIGQKIELKDVDAATLSKSGSSAGSMLGSSDDDSSSSSSPASTLKIVKKGDTLELSGSFGEDAAKDSSGSGMDMDALGSMGKKPEIRYKFTFPGKVISANGKIDGNSVTWKPALDKKTVFKAVAKAS